MTLSTSHPYRSSLDVAAIGNGRIAALIDQGARIVWWCFPRLDGDPIFCRLLAGDEEKGFCDVVLDGQVSATSYYIRNTCILETILVAENGASVKVTDFCPRFWRYDRPFHPAQLVRRIEPLRGRPRIPFASGQRTTTANLSSAPRMDQTTFVISAAPHPFASRPIFRCLTSRTRLRSR